MSDQNKETQSSKPQAMHVSEEKKQQVVAKIKELFERENFKKNVQLTSCIVNPTTNAIQHMNLYRDKQFTELGVDVKTLDEILKRDELKSHIIYNLSDFTIAPTWKKLRNILYINAGKDFQALIEEDIKTVTTEYKLENTQADTIKVTVTTLNQEESLTSDLFNKLFNKTYTLPDNKSISISCAIEEEQFAHSTFHPAHTYKTSMNSYPNNRNFETPFYGGNNPNMMAIPPQFFMIPKIAEYNRQQQFPRGGKQNRNVKPFPNPHFANKNGLHYNNNAKTAGNNLHQPANHVNKQQTKQGGQNKGGKFNKPGNNKGGKQSQRLFNPSESDFPSLQ